MSGSKPIVAMLVIVYLAFPAVREAKATPSIDFEGNVTVLEISSFEFEGIIFPNLGKVSGQFTAASFEDLEALSGVDPANLEFTLIDLVNIATSNTIETASADLRSVGDEWGGALIGPGGFLGRARNVEIRYTVNIERTGGGTPISFDYFNGTHRGSFEFVPDPGNFLGETLGDELALLTDGSMLVAFAVEVDNFGPCSDNPCFTGTLSWVPIVPEASFDAGVEQESELLGGAGAPGGLGVSMAPTRGGSVTVHHESLDQAELNEHLLEGQQATFRLPGERTQLWEVDTADGLEFELAVLVFTYDDRELGSAFSEFDLRINHFVDGRWVALEPCEEPEDTSECVIEQDALANRITAQVRSFSPFALGQVPEPTAVLLQLAALLTLAGLARPRRGSRRA